MRKFKMRAHTGHCGQTATIGGYHLASTSITGGHGSGHQRFDLGSTPA